MIAHLQGTSGVQSQPHLPLTSQSLLPAAGTLPLGAGRPLNGLEHRPLDRRDPLLEAGRASPWEAWRGSKLARELGLAQARIRVVVSQVTSAARAAA